MQKTDGITVKWQVANEADITTYSVERSMDGVHFVSINISKAIGAATYSIQDASLPPSASTLYYRIKSIDNIGMTNYSTVVKLKTIDLRLTTFSIYPNPVQSKLNITLAGATTGGLYKVRITTFAGKEAFSKVDVPLSGKFITLDARSLAAGVYMIELTDSKGNKLLDKFVKQ